MYRKSILSIAILIFCVFFLISEPLSYAQTPSSDLSPSPQITPSPSISEGDIRNKIKELEGKISDLRGQEKSLSTQIAVMNNQISLSELRMQSTEADIADLSDNIKLASKKITHLEGTFDETVKVILNRIVANYKTAGTAHEFYMFTSRNFSDAVDKEAYLKLAQDHDRKLLYDIQQAKNDYSNQKEIFENKVKKLESLKLQLESYKKDLASQQDQKKTLLAQTQGDEANYQKLLAAAQAQLAGFSRFAESQGGGLLSNQTSCDDWGCYYNQRDSQWGGLSLNGTQYSIASDGCLVTSMAMVLSHYGHKVTPIDINSNSNNFASYYPAYLLYTISVDGITAQRIGTTIDSTLSSGNPVIVGVHAYGGTHFVVLKSGSGGDYKMRDPYLENGKDIPFSDHYSVGSIFEVDKVVIQ